MTSLLPSDLARKRLAKRAQQQIALTANITPKELLKTPSQKRSESGRKKFLKRAGQEKVKEVPMMYDCRECPDENECPYGKDFHKCDKQADIHRCLKCGQKVTYRWIKDKPFELCLVCRS